ncbi:MAG: CDP-glucose 4,6-dehydratase [Pseudomonadota bacterium]|nr:CDP-glucose 4,6-dehydratase [Pseudomonadota bacterium]
MNTSFWLDKRVLITGHTGFKGSWLALWLQRLGATVVGYALPPSGTHSLFLSASVGNAMTSVFADIRDQAALQKLIDRFKPEVVFHLAAQPLVRKSYAEPRLTYEVNVLGTVHLLEAVRRSRSCRVVVNVTSDKCYENLEQGREFREIDPLGGHDPYSSSKGCAELVTAAYRRSFFTTLTDRRVGVATARAGNVIGGGDFSADRLIPDFITALRAHTPLQVRHPHAIRPWQHVLEPLAGYLMLAEKLWHEPGRYSCAWNFGPRKEDARSVQWIVTTLSELCGEPLGWRVDGAQQLHEAAHLTLDSSKARRELQWQPRWTLERALRAVVEWHRAYDTNPATHDVVLRQIACYDATPLPTMQLEHQPHLREVTC